MATSTFNAQEIEIRRKLLHEELAALETEKIKNLGAMQVMDYHHPERTPGWPIYNLNDPRNKYPQMLYHPSALDMRIEEQRLGIRRRNEANPHLAPMDMPPSECLKIKVGTLAEKQAAMADGFIEAAPQRQMVDMNSPAELIGRAKTNPLMEASQPVGLSVETIIKLNQMPKDELLKHALEATGITFSPDASKVEIITAMQKGPYHAANVA